MLASKNEYISGAYDHLQIISQDKQKRLEYEARQKAILDHNQLMFEAEQRAKQAKFETEQAKSKSINIFKKLLDKGYDIGFISEITSISVSEIENLCKEFK